MRHFFTTVIFPILRIFNRLIKAKSVKKYILTDQLKDVKNNKFTQNNKKKDSLCTSKIN